MTSETWETEDFDTVLEWLKDTLDIPLTELTVEQIHKDFDDPRQGPLPEDKALKILKYYNGRLALYKTIVKDLEDHETRKVLHYGIPEEYNGFWVYGEDDGSIKQIDAYIEIVIS